MTKQEEIREIKQGLKEISEGKVVPLSLIEKRQEIREDVAWKLFAMSDYVKEPGVIVDIRQTIYWEQALDFMGFLDVRGVVIKVDRELPKVETYCKLANVECIPKLSVQQDMLKAGYVAVEPLLIKEVKHEG